MLPKVLAGLLGLYLPTACLAAGRAELGSSARLINGLPWLKGWRGLPDRALLLGAITFQDQAESVT